MNSNAILIWNTILVLLPVLSFARFTTIDVAVNLVSIVSLYLLARDMKICQFFKLASGAWAVMFVQVFVTVDWNFPVKVVMTDMILSVLPIVSGGLIVSVLVIVGRKFISPNTFQKWGMKVLLIPPIIVFFALYYFVI